MYSTTIICLSQARCHCSGCVVAAFRGCNRDSQEIKRMRQLDLCYLTRILSWRGKKREGEQSMPRCLCTVVLAWARVAQAHNLEMPKCQVPSAITLPSSSGKSLPSGFLVSSPINPFLIPNSVSFLEFLW